MGKAIITWAFGFFSLLSLSLCLRSSCLLLLIDTTRPDRSSFRFFCPANFSAPYSTFYTFGLVLLCCDFCRDAHIFFFHPMFFPCHCNDKTKDNKLKPLRTLPHPFLVPYPIASHRIVSYLRATFDDRTKSLTWLAAYRSRYKSNIALTIFIYSFLTTLKIEIAI